MPLDDRDVCGLGWLSLSKEYWLTGVCKKHDTTWVMQNKSFVSASKEFWTNINIRREQLGKSRIEGAVIWTIGTVIGAPIWFGRYLFRKIKG